MSTLSHFPLSLLDAWLSTVMCGLTLHLLFNRFEKRRLRLLIGLLMSSPSLSVYALLPHYPHLPVAILIVATYITTYTTLIISIILYRISTLHPLSTAPGPVLAKCSKFWGIYHTATGKMHIKLLELHRRYGPIVRTGPNELSVCERETINQILGPNGMGKGPIWDGRRAPKNRFFSLIGIRDTTTHLKRRKPWNKALNVSSVRKYEPILQRRIAELMNILRLKADQEVDVAEMISFFSYDFMGDMAFGGGFELMRDGDTKGLWKLMEGGVRVHAFAQHIPWALPVFHSLPSMGVAAMKLRKFVIAMSEKRINHGKAAAIHDISSHLLKSLSYGDYCADAALAIIAGSDTTATALSSIIFYLLSNKALFDRLRKELDDNFPPGHSGPLADGMSSKLTGLSFLNAVINEALRLQPPVPTGIQRAPNTGSGGQIIDSIFVPDDTAIYLPPYVIHRDPRYFRPDPSCFWPDRWLLSEETIETNRTAFIPFSLGPMNCAGKLLAQLELCAVVAALVQTFDMELVPGWNPSEWEDNLEDYFVFKKGRLPILLRERAK